MILSPTTPTPSFAVKKGLQSLHQTSSLFKETRLKRRIAETANSPWVLVSRDTRWFLSAGAVRGIRFEFFIWLRDEVLEGHLAILSVSVLAEVGKTEGTSRKIK